ncbi:MAG: site-specific DNA-methyltransferase [Pseudomonadota bacterium]
MPSYLLMQADARHIPLADASVDCVVTSPPYWGLRDYGVAGQIGLEPRHDCLGWATGQPCGECWVCQMASVFGEVRRVLKPRGTCWVNLGDTYTSGNRTYRDADFLLPARGMQSRAATPAGLKPKDLCGIPWRFALALQRYGWWLRSEIIWVKPNPMPESVKDRPTKAHEQVFLLTKSWRYYYDHEAVREPLAGKNLHDLTGPGYHAPGQTAQTGTRYPRPQGWAGEGAHTAVTHQRGTKRRTGRPEIDTRGDGQDSGEMTYPLGWRALRTVWSIPTQPTPEAHFATFPQRLAETCILAGCPAGGILLDPFVGSGTTCRAAESLGRKAIGLDLSWSYLAEIASPRCAAPVQPVLTLGNAPKCEANA